MRTWKRLITLVCIFLMGNVSTTSAQTTYLLQVMNEAASGTNFEFDIYLLRTGPTPIYLGDCDFKFDFNTANFTAPAAVKVSKGLAPYGMSPAIVGGIYIINLAKPVIDLQEDFDANVANISNTGNGTFVGRFQITNISNPGGTAGLTWRHPPTTNATVVTTLDPAYPWNGSNITSSDPLVYVGSNTQLPIRLATFTAKPDPDGSGVRLEWSTLSEVNNYGFYVQRRIENEQQFADVPGSFVAGHGTTIEPQNYSFVDRALRQQGTYYYRLRQVDLDGKEHFSSALEFSVDIALTSVTEAAPIEFKLQQNFPNPFNPTTEFKFSVETTGRATLHIYSITGQLVAVLFDELAEAGRYYRVGFDGRSVASGVYFYRLESGPRWDIKKMLLLK